ncbi:MAG: DNA replication initiation control protein YabA [Streptococcaceae bacterium]|jgi:regulator of replication initiation timing|nr:DNA replication initiation control protein YabA [Streptococcaceae bacterium]
MDKRTLYDGLDSLEEVLSNSLRTISLMKKNIKSLIEKNNTLELENTRLRERLDTFETGKENAQKAVAVEVDDSSTLQMLEELYHDGFHVCHPFYGQRRENDEPCAWCSDFWAQINEDK